MVNSIQKARATGKQEEYAVGTEEEERLGAGCTQSVNIIDHICSTLQCVKHGVCDITFTQLPSQLLHKVDKGLDRQTGISGPDSSSTLSRIAT